MDYYIFDRVEEMNNLPINLPVQEKSQNKNPAKEWGCQKCFFWQYTHTLISVQKQTTGFIWLNPLIQISELDRSHSPLCSLKKQPHPMFLKQFPVPTRRGLVTPD